MRKFILLIVLSLPLVLAAQPKEAMNKEIAAVLAEMQNFDRQQWSRDSARKRPLRSHNEEVFAEEAAFSQKMYNRLEKLPEGSLSFDDQINKALLQHKLLDEIRSFQYKAYLNPILSDWGFHTTLAGRAGAAFRTKRDVERYLEMLNDMPRYVDEHLALMRKGLALGISQPAVILKGYEATYNQHVVDSVEASAFWRPFAKKPAAIDQKDWAELQAAARPLIEKNAIGSFRQIQAFFNNEYLPKTRTTLGASLFPNGKAYYEDRVRHYTTTSLSSEEVYQIGLKEVARIKAQMDSVLKAVDYKGSFQQFIAYLRTDPKFYPKTAEDLLKEASFIAKKVDGKLPSLFGKLPRQPYTVAPVPDYLAPTYTTGRYSGAPVSGTRAGEYWVNTFNLPSRTLYTLEALTLHEAVPGHHLQIALTQELEHLPDFRKNFYINAFGEGWGLYSEYLGHEMGFYKDPYSLFGRLTYEMWRACRLVIDVGLHTKNWTREEAVKYLADNTALSLHEVNTEINRYISWPGQALAYKMGEIKIKELRSKAEAALGADFDIREFHDMLLSNGTVTLALLDKMTAKFIQHEKKKKKKA